ncbi:undecaprenyldiphospho-muramoylpentapeptide beta-N-acetylglucosaminyltransferase [Blattabacterium cuenoti]|nr:undecaprenyldiphospho-muramoylpentapeptide beta-N-acetylglucosaminyltransferase [Blattabacterium cuenoti]
MFPKIIIGSGGTGGHIFTGIAIANELKKQIPKSDILFIGSKNHMEMKKIPKSGYIIKGLSLSGGRNKLYSIYSVFVLFTQLINSFLLANKIIKNFSPNIVIGTGGFVSFPTLCAAKNNKIPILIQEQNSFPGLTNRIFSRYAKKICVAYEQTRKFFPEKKTIITGNPVRSNILDLPSKKNACINLGLKINKPIILSMGGSQGDNFINKVWIKSGLKKLIHMDLQLIWQIGNFDIIKENKISKHPNLVIMDFIDDISICYAAADIIVSRAGALTISETCLIGKPHILVPLPHSLDDHQNKNAKILEEKNAAIIIKNEELECKLIDSITKLVNNISIRKTMKKNMLKLGKPNATNDITKEILRIIL